MHRALLIEHVGTVAGRTGDDAGPKLAPIMGRLELIADRLLYGLRQSRELPDVEIDPAAEIILGFPRHEQDLGHDHSGFGHQPTPGLGHHRRSTKPRLNQCRHPRSIGLGLEHRIAIEGREPTTDIDQRQVMALRPARMPDLGHGIERLRPHARIPGLGAHMEAEPNGPQPEIGRPIHETQGHLRGAAELARERPVRPGRPDKHAQEHPRARRVCSDLVELGLRIRREEINPMGMGIGDVRHPLDRVPEGDLFRRRARGQRHLDLAARCRIEPATLGRQCAQHFRRRVGLHRIMDQRALPQPARQSVVLGHHRAAIQHQRRAIEHAPIDKRAQAIFDGIRSERNRRNGRHTGEPGYVSVHGHLHQTRALAVPTSTKEDVTVAT